MPQAPDHSEISFEEFEARKQAARAALNSLPPDEAQREAESILFPRLWEVADPEALAWPGDLTDDLDEVD